MLVDYADIDSKPWITQKIRSETAAQSDPSTRWIPRGMGKTVRSGA
jgi:hypothetical protein